MYISNWAIEPDLDSNPCGSEDGQAFLSDNESEEEWDNGDSYYDLRHHSENEGTEVQDRCLLRPEHAGLQVAREACEMYYSRNHFMFNQARNLRPFLIVDLFHLGIRPHEHVRNLHIPFRCEPLNLNSELEECRDGKLEEKFLQSRVGRLEKAFASIEDKSRLCIELGIHTIFGGRKDVYPPPDDPAWKRDVQRKFFNILEAVWGLYWGLREAAAELRVRQHDNYYRFHNEDNEFVLFDDRYVAVRKVSAYISDFKYFRLILRARS